MHISTYIYPHNNIHTHMHTGSTEEKFTTVLSKSLLKCHELLVYVLSDALAVKSTKQSFDSSLLQLSLLKWMSMYLSLLYETA